MQQNSKCRLCGDRDEMVNYIKSKQVPKEYKTWHDWVGKVINWEMCKSLKFNLSTKWKSRQSCKKSSSNWYAQIKNPIYRSKTNHKEIYIRQMAEIMGQSDPKQTPWNTRSYRRVANRLQKHQKRRSNTCQIAYWAHPHYSFTPVKRGGCPSVPIMQSTTHNQTYPSKL